MGEREVEGAESKEWQGRYDHHKDKPLTQRGKAKEKEKIE